MVITVKDEKDVPSDKAYLFQNNCCHSKMFSKTNYGNRAILSKQQLLK